MLSTLYFLFMMFNLSYKLNPGEKFAGLARKHWFMLGAATAEPFLIIALLIVFVNKALIFRQSAAISLALAAILAAYFIYRWILWKTDYYVITSERILKIAQPGVFTRSLEEISLKDISDIFLKTKGPAASILKFGTVKILLSNGNVFKLENISNPEAIYQAIVKLKDI